jgi:hypothetical protein
VERDTEEFSMKGDDEKFIHISGDRTRDISP